jgi:hypothetical protein
VVVAVSSLYSIMNGACLRKARTLPCMPQSIYLTFSCYCTYSTLCEEGPFDSRYSIKTHDGHKSQPRLSQLFHLCSLPLPILSVDATAFG